jgi:hypothetical protein
MRRIACLLLLGSVICYPAFTQQGGSDHLTGIVVSENGMPVEGVRIIAWKDATTDAEGRFDLSNRPSKDSLVYIDKDGFRPTTLVIRSQTNALKVILEDDSKTTWAIPSCLERHVKTSPKGASLEFELPKNAKVRGSKDIDYQDYVMSLTNVSKPLQLGYGPMVIPFQMEIDLTLRSASFEERSIRSFTKSGQIIGHDRRGKTEDGMVWRFVDLSSPSASVSYKGLSDEEAAVYDRIIDSACQLLQ